MQDAKSASIVRNSVLVVSAIAWVLLFVQTDSMHAHMHYHSNGIETTPVSVSFTMIFAMIHFGALVAGWGLMLVAMMSPVLVVPIHDIYMRVFKRRRIRSIAIFVTGYAAIWFVVGGVLLVTQLSVNLVSSGPYLTAAGAIILALIWQCSPIKQHCLNRCHAQGELATFGAAADVDALRYGVTHGIWCAGSCWALMLCSMLLPWGHVLGMAIACLVMISESFETPEPPCWSWRVIRKVARIVVAQARLRLRVLRLGRRPVSVVA